MKAATPRPSGVPVLTLCAALAAALPAAWAGDEPVVPFPETAMEGREARVPGPAAGSSPGTAPGPASAEGPEGPAVPVAAGEAGRGPERPVAVEDRKDAPAAGSRLLQALSRTKAPEAAASPVTAPVFAAEGCPRALLRRLLAGAAGEADALSALAIEREILTLCRERQEIVTALFETEARLRELREATGAPEPEPPVSAAGSAPAPGAEPPREAPAVLIAEPSPLRAALAAAADKEALPSPRYAWFSIIGTEGALRAGVTDGAQLWFVREGDSLPGAGTVAAIAGRPPGVRVTGAGEDGSDTAPLPYRSRPGGGP